MQNVIGGLAQAVIGIMLLINPHGVWAAAERWKQAGAAEPSPAFVVIARVLGGVLMVVGVLVATGAIR